MNNHELHPTELMNATPEERRRHNFAVAENDREFEQERTEAMSKSSRWEMFAWRPGRSPAVPDDVRGQIVVPITQANAQYECPKCHIQLCGEFSEPPYCRYGHSAIPMEKRAA